jgi:HAMP domain-containing protein
MADFDPYAFIQHVMRDTLDYLQKRCLRTSHLAKVNYVAVLAYGSSACVVIPRAKFVILHHNDVLGMYSQSIPIPPVVDWLCDELQEPFGEDVDIVSLAVAYFSVLDNNRTDANKVIDPSMVRSDLLRYSLFYYLLRVDIHMNRWVSSLVCQRGVERVPFVYEKTLHYLVELSKYNGEIDLHHDEIDPTDCFLESFYPMIKIVSSYVSADLELSLVTV